MTRKITLVRPSEMFRVFEDSMSNFISDVGMPNLGSSISVNIKDLPDRFEVTAQVPGYTKENIEIAFQENMLILEGKMSEKSNTEENNFVMQEYREGSFKRSVALPGKVDTDSVEATLDSGVLTLKLPKQPEIMPKKIAIK
ncbi:MAG: Hsp20/alpha crystallin family protein [Candidatus Dojkabacteria bacterium]